MLVPRSIRGPHRNVVTVAYVSRYVMNVPSVTAPSACHLRSINTPYTAYMYAVQENLYGV